MITLNRRLVQVIGFPFHTFHYYPSQRGIKIGDVTYDELPKEMLIMVIKDEDKDFAVTTIMEAARTEPKGAFGDGKIFITPVEEAYTISRGTKEL